MEFGKVLLYTIACISCLNCWRITLLLLLSLTNFPSETYCLKKLSSAKISFISGSLLCQITLTPCCQEDYNEVGCIKWNRKEIHNRSGKSTQVVIRIAGVDSGPAKQRLSLLHYLFFFAVCAVFSYHSVLGITRMVFEYSCLFCSIESKGCESKGFLEKKVPLCGKSDFYFGTVYCSRILRANYLCPHSY